MTQRDPNCEAVKALADRNLGLTEPQERKGGREEKLEVLQSQLRGKDLWR